MVFLIATSVQSSPWLTHRCHSSYAIHPSPHCSCQVYRTGLKNQHLDLHTVKTWILNAVLYAVVFCLLWFNVVAPSFKDYDLYAMGTTIYVGLVLALQLKVSFIHHLWNQVHFWSMFISIGGLFLFLVVLNTMTSSDTIDFYFTANKIYSMNLFWFFGVFSVPLFCILIDFCGHAFRVVFLPTHEMIYREASAGLGSVEKPESDRTDLVSK
jgi:magnesium-transporting ATPase (P-type)